MGMKVVLAGEIYEPGKQLLKKTFDVEQLKEPSRELVLASVHDADGLIVRIHPLVDREVLSGAPRLKVVGRFGVGYDNIDVAEATARGIAVVYTPGANADAVAEHAFALMLSLAKRLKMWEEALLSGNFNLRYQRQSYELKGKTLGLIGFGHVGRAVAKRALAFGMQVLAYDPYLKPEQDRDFLVQLVPLEELLRGSDYVSLHAPLTEETKGMLNAQTLELMKPGAFLINTARGGLMNLDAAYKALLGGRLAGIALDVFPEEPPDTSHPIFTHPNLVVTPHVAAHTQETLERMGLTVAEEVSRVLLGEKPRYLANPQVLTTTANPQSNISSP